jgi:outer membrane biosynthesis protein TonB
MPGESIVTGQGRPGLEEGKEEPTLMVAGIVTTLLLHGLIVGLVVWGTMRSDADMKEKVEPKMMEFEDVKLLKLGEKKPAKQLPRIANPSKPSPKQETVALDQKEKPEPKPKEEEPEKTQQKVEQPPEEPPEEKTDESKDRQKAMAQAFDSLNNPNRPSNNVVPEGSKKGLAEGTVSDEAMANLMGTFQSKLLEQLGKHWSVPTTIPDEELKKLYGRVVVYVRLSKSGHVVTYRFKKKSGNSQFDGSIERLLRKFQVSGGGRSLPLPENPEVRRAVLEQGLNLRSWEATER